jgi:hypothetical protein
MGLLTIVTAAVSNNRESEEKMNAQDGRAMFELQLELHSRATGQIPNISADDLLEVHEALADFSGDFKSLFAAQA